MVFRHENFLWFSSSAADDSAAILNDINTLFVGGLSKIVILINGKTGFDSFIVADEHFGSFMKMRDLSIG